MTYKCPTCNRSVKRASHEDSKTARFFPFCCERCKLIDLGSWFDADYRIPTAATGESDEVSAESEKSTKL